MILTITNKFRSLRFLDLIYILIFLTFLIIVTRDLNYNTAFVDEAIYATVGEEALRGSFWERGLSWMGGSYIYPVISAYINRNMGLTGVRLFSVFTVLVAAFVSGEIAKKLSGGRARIITVALFLFTGISLNLAQLGTYDAPALLFFTLAFYFGLLARYGEKFNSLSILLSAFSFSMAVMCKYIVIVFLPVFPVLFFRFRWKYLLHLILWTSFTAEILGTFAYFNYESLVVLFSGSAFKEPTSRLKIITDTIKYINVFIPLSILGAGIVFWKKRNKHLFLLLAMIAAGMAPFSYHFVFENARSMWKHLVFSLVTLAPLASIFLLYVYKKFIKLVKTSVFVDNASQAVLSGVILISVLLLRHNFKDHWIFQRSWPSATPSLEFLEANRRDTDIILAEGSAVYKYHLYAGFQNPPAWASTWFMWYEDKTGLEAMKEAIKDQHFDFVVLNAYFTGDIVYELKPVLSEYYDVVHSDIYKESGLYDTETFIWVPKNRDREYIGLK